MNDSQIKWIWQLLDWPKFHWQERLIQPLLREVRLKQGILIGKTGAVAENISLESALDTLLQNIIASSAIEGERLNEHSVRSSLAKRIGLHLKQPYPTTERSDSDLLDKGCFEKLPGGGRSTRYQITSKFMKRVVRDD